MKKVKVGFSVDSNISDEFNQYCDDRAINKSKLVNKILSDFLTKQKNKSSYVEK